MSGRILSPTQDLALSAQDALDQGNNIFATIVVASFFVGFILCVASFLFSKKIPDSNPGSAREDMHMYRTKMITSIYGFAIYLTDLGTILQERAILVEGVMRFTMMGFWGSPFSTNLCGYFSK